MYHLLFWTSYNESNWSLSKSNVVGIYDGILLFILLKASSNNSNPACKSTRAYISALVPSSEGESPSPEATLPSTSYSPTQLAPPLFPPSHPFPPTPTSLSNVNKVISLNDCSQQLMLATSLGRPIMKEAVILYPPPAIGHLIAMVELGKLVLTHRPSLSVHILLINQAYDAGDTAPYVSSVSATSPSISFHRLSAPSLPPDFKTTSPNHETLAFELIRLNNPDIRRSLLTISEEYSIKAFVMDDFCSAALPVARDLGIPCYFFASGAGMLGFFFYLPCLHQTLPGSFKDMNSLLHTPG